MTRKQIEQRQYFRAIERLTERELDRELTIAYREMIMSLSQHLMENLIDYRSRKPEYPLYVVLMTIIIGIIFGANDVQSIETHVKNNPSKVRALLGMVREKYPRMPSDTTMERVLCNLNDVELLTAICEWSDSTFLSKSSDSLRHVAIDGKACRAALEKISGLTYPPFILNAFDGATGSIVAQMSINRKTNELGVLPQLIDTIGNLNGIVITTDAFASHPHIMADIDEHGGVIIMPSKGNQGGIHYAVNTFLNDAFLDMPEKFTTFHDKDDGIYAHGRICYRTYSLISENVGELFVGTDYEGLVSSIGFVKRVTQHVMREKQTGELVCTSVSVEELAYLINSSDLSVEQFAKYVREHWSACEVIHYLLDTELDEDRCRVHTGYGMQNFSLLRKVAVAILKAIQMKIKRASLGTIREFLQSCGGIPADYCSKSISSPDTQAS